MLSDHFADHEFRCRCGCGKLLVSDRLLDSMEALRELTGLPIHILSGCRCWTHNLAEGGVTNSGHLCENEDLELIPTIAGDIYIATLKPRGMFRAALKIPDFKEGGIGVYAGQGFVHLDVRGYKARWYVEHKGAKHTGIPRNFY